MPTTVWRGRIAFGMVSIPVRLHKAARRERIRFHNVYRANAEPSIEDEPEPPVMRQPIEEEPEIPARGPGTSATAMTPERVPEQIVRAHNAPAGGTNAAPLMKG